MRNALFVALSLLIVGCLAETAAEWIPIPFVCTGCEARCEEQLIPHPDIQIQRSVCDSRGPGYLKRFEKLELSRAGVTFVATPDQGEPSKINIVRQTNFGTEKVLSADDFESDLFRDVVEFLHELGRTEFDFRCYRGCDSRISGLVAFTLVPRPVV